MKFNLLRFSNLNSYTHKNYLWILIVFLAVLLIVSFWQIGLSKSNVLEQKNLNLLLQNDLIKIKNSFLDLQKSDAVNKSREYLIPDEQAKQSPVIFESININYANASDIIVLLREKGGSLLSAQGNIFADSRTNTILLQDHKQETIKIKQLIKSLDVPKRQVLIEARIVNMERNSAQDLGVRFGFMRSHAKDLGSGGESSQVKPSHLNFDLGALPLDANPASLGLALATLGKNALLDLELSALQSEGKAQIIASPRLITTNQEPAVIESGEDIPYQRITASGGTSVAFKKAVLSLKVVPQITFDGKLIMSISINQDSDSGKRVQGVPIISTKSLETRVMIDDNQTIVLGGIYKQDKNHSIIRVPVLGALPVFGWLFRRTEQKLRNEELLIFITPQIIAI